MHQYPDIEAYGFIGDGHSAALISTSGCVDWMCMPRIDSPSVFGRLLDWNQGGHLSISPQRHLEVSRRYLEDTLVLETTFETESGTAVLTDCFAMRAGGRLDPRRQLLRVLDCIEGRVEFSLFIDPHFEYATVRPWVRRRKDGLVTAVAGRTGLYLDSDMDMRIDRHRVEGSFSLSAGERRRLSIVWTAPEHVDVAQRRPIAMAELDARLDETVEWWREWSARACSTRVPGAIRSGIVLKAMINAPTGAMVAAPTTSLPEEIGGVRNWDYRYSWIRDSIFALRALSELGMTEEAEGFRRFVQRTTGGGADELAVMYGIGGEFRLTEFELPHLEGYSGSRPVRVGNAAQGQTQLDMYGHVLDLARRWVDRGEMPDDDYWTFIGDVADLICEVWKEPDKGIWEVRSEPRHFVHSKIMCWAGLDAAIHIADRCDRQAAQSWRTTRDEMRELILDRGTHPTKGHFVAAFDEESVDAALLLIPTVGFVAWDDARMTATIDAIRRDLEADDGLVVRYRGEDGLTGQEGVFLACSFWLVEALARSGRPKEAQRVFDRVTSTANELGLFAEEYDVETGRMLGNYPQALTHLAHICAALALNEIVPVG